MPDLSVGDIVFSAKNATWGRGKVVARDGSWAYVVFEGITDSVAKRLDPERAGLKLMPGESVPLLDFLPPFKKSGTAYVLERRRVSLQDLASHFIRTFPGRFDDPAYIGKGGSSPTGERSYKWAAHRAFLDAFGNGRAEELLAAKDGRRIAEGIRRVLTEQHNLLATQEKMAFLGAIQDETASVDYLSALLEYLGGKPTERSFEIYARAVERLPVKTKFRVATWPIATLLPFLSLKWSHMFLKPSVADEAAKVLGVDLKYRTQLNWTTYERLLFLHEQVKDDVVALGARDSIDIQSFIWTALKYP